MIVIHSSDTNDYRLYVYRKLKTEMRNKNTCLVLEKVVALKRASCEEMV